MPMKIPLKLSYQVYRKFGMNESGSLHRLILCSKRNSSEVVKKTMLQCVRISAGLGVPPSPFYTNAVESINGLLKLRTGHSKQNLVSFITKLNELISSQFEEVNRALAGLGDYKVAYEYSKFHYSAANWCAMSEQQKKRVLNQFLSLKPEEVTSSSQESSSLLPDEVVTPPNPLACLGNIDYVAETIWKAATELVEADNAVVRAPGQATSLWMVARSSSSKSKPYCVSMQKRHYECESDCIYYHTSKVCAHIVAVAMTNGDLQKFIDWHSKQQHGINVTSLAESGLPVSSVGKKASKRKGVSKKKSAKISEEIAGASQSSWKPRAALKGVSPIPTVRPTPYSTSASVHSQVHVSVSSPTASGSHVGISGSAASIQCLPTSSPPGLQQQQQQQQLNPFLVAFIQGNISICFGCKQHYQKPAIPPNNLCILHREWRAFTTPSNPVPQSRFGNAYYHLNATCVQAMWPTFDPRRDLQLPPETANYLLPCHKALLMNFGY